MDNVVGLVCFSDGDVGISSCLWVDPMECWL